MGATMFPNPSEGGHSDYAPRNEDEIDLLRFLKQKYNGRISFERVVSVRGSQTATNFCARCAALKSRHGWPSK
ncbi:MAG: glucokinase [Terracidiphilus sp.]